MSTPIKKKGRPKKMTPAIEEQALTLIATTDKGIKSICKLCGISHETFFKQIHESNDFAERYARAKEQQAHIYEGYIIERAKRKSSDSVSAMDKKIEIDTIKWAMAHRVPNKYGSAQQVTLKGQSPDEVPAPIQHEINYPGLSESALLEIVAAAKPKPI
jgi:hypothetical protein